MLTVKTKYGVLQGEREHGYSVFKGVRYAAPPVGPRRFAPAEPPEAWEGVRPALQYGAPAMQLFTKDHITQPDLLNISREDCLFANIRTPAPIISDGTGNHPDPEAGLPVYVFIHGGSFETGGGNLPLYSGDAFAQKGIVYVNINYRLGVFGCMTLETLRKENRAAGGQSITDVKQALAWVHENISAFGGDPANVTIGGESAGSALVSLMIHTDAAGRDFQRAIMESGSARGFCVKSQCGRGSLEMMLSQCREYAALFDADDDEAGLAKLREIPADDLIKRWYFNEDGSYRDHVSDPLSYGSVFSEDLLPDPLSQPIGDVDLLFGYNTDEGTMFTGREVTAEKYASWIISNYPKHAREILMKYPADDETAAAVLADLVGFLCFKSGEIVYADALADRGRKVYGYHFDYMTDTLREEGLGVRHIAELNFVFDRFLRLVGADDVSGRRTAEMMNEAWSGFIKYGDPSLGSDRKGSGIKWDAYDPRECRILRIDHSPHMERAEGIEEMRYFSKVTGEEYSHEA